MRSTQSRKFGSIPTATGGIARLACARMRELGKDVEAVLSRAGLTIEEADDPTARLEVPTQIKVLELAAEELQDELLGFRLALGFDLREVGLVYYVMASSELLADALRNAQRYSAIVNEGIRLYFSLDRTTAILLDYVNVDRRLDRHQMEFWLVALVRMCRQLTDSRLAVRQLKVRHSRANIPEEFKSFFAGDIQFGADVDEITFSMPVASLKTVGRDTHLNNLLRQYAEEALADQSATRPGIRRDVQKIISQLLPHGRAEASEVARQLGMSSRTLSRKLRDEGGAYTEILNELRAVLAKRYLRDHELAVTEVTWLLGYREVSSFTHAFKRWTGMTPRKFRSSS